jgi:DNA polymerase-1
MIEFDVETTGLQWYAHELFLAQFYAPEIPGLHRPVLHDHRLLTATDQTYLIQRNLSLGDDYRAWNTKFDLHFLLSAGYELPPESRWHDGMVMAHIVDERWSVALQRKGNDLFGKEAAGQHLDDALKAWLAQETARRRKQAKADKAELVLPNYSDVPSEIMDPYAAHDVTLQRQVCDVLQPRIDENPDFQSLYAMERGVLAALFHAERRGIPIDRPAMAALEADLLPRLDEAEDRCVRIADFKPFNPRSPKQVSEALDRLGADTRFMQRDSETKILVTDEENLRACDHALAEAILHYRGLHKLYEWMRRCLHGKPEDKLFPHPYLTDADRLHPDFKQVGARTGRMSCSNPNFQNINRDDLRLRYCVAAPPGQKLVCVDLEGIELRLLAAFAGEGALLNMIRSGADPHQHTADMVGLKGRKRSTGAFESSRDQGKRYNYLKNYGGGLRATRRWLGKSLDEARAMRDRYNEAYPEVRDLEQEIEITLEDQGYIRTPWGRRHRVKKSAEQEAYMFTAYLLQGTAGDLFKDATVKVHDQGVPLIAFVHDELIALVDEADAEEAGEIMVKALTDHPAITEKVPLEAEAQIVDRWSDAKKQGWVPDHEREQ